MTVGYDEVCGAVLRIGDHGCVLVNLVFRHGVDDFFSVSVGLQFREAPRPLVGLAEHQRFPGGLSISQQGHCHAVGSVAVVVIAVIPDFGDSDRQLLRFHRVGYSGLGEGQGLAFLAVAVHGVEHSGIVGVQFRGVCASVPVIRAIGPRFLLGVGQLHRVSQLHRGEIADGLVDVPDEVLFLLPVASEILHREGIASVHRLEAVFVLTQLHRRVAFAAHLQNHIFGLDKVKVIIIGHIAHVVHDLGATVHQVKDVVPDLAEVHGLSIGQEAHEAGAPQVLLPGFGACRHGIAVILCGSRRIGLIGEAEGLIHGVDIAGLILHRR